MYGDELDESSGGHLHGTGRPDKSEFPPDWDEDKIVHEVIDVARRPDRVTKSYSGDSWLATGVRNEVKIRVVVREDGTIATGYPLDGPGVDRKSN
ncbi:MAG: EndoU domain-containing protein [Micromonosporaceae bacterium]